MARRKGRKPLFEGSDWNFDTLKRTYDAIAGLASERLGLDTYPNQLEIITSEQMLDAYSSIGMPVFYRHWSFGKRFSIDEQMYRKGYAGLAYEIVINSNPCIAYLMEENSMTMQALVMAHASFGHNHFFKNNQLFQEWSDAEGILDYLQFAKRYVTRCEERYGLAAVERVLDAAHALMDHGVDRYERRSRPSLAQEELKAQERREHAQAIYNDLWRTVPVMAARADADLTMANRRSPEPGTPSHLGLPEENLLYFIEKYSPRLENWQREILRIVRNIAQYFYPQKQTKVMNEGCATYVHYTLMNMMYDEGLITEGSMLEFIDSHSQVVAQPNFDDPRFSGMNPYALGFAMMQDIYRIATDPTEEDKAVMPDLAGSGDGMAALRKAWAEHRDESFILQYLSPSLIRKLRLFKLDDNPRLPHMRIDAIHDERGYARVRRGLAKQYDLGSREPNIQVTDVNLHGDRRLMLTHRLYDGVGLDEADARAVLRYVAALWGYAVRLVGIDAETEATVYAYEVDGPG